MGGDDADLPRLWQHIRDELPKDGRGKQARRLRLRQLPSAARRRAACAVWPLRRSVRSGMAARRRRRLTPPVFIVVCNNTSDIQAGLRLHRRLREDAHATARRTSSSRASCSCSPTSRRARTTRFDRPNTILIDSGQLESGEALSDDFQKLAAPEIEEFKPEYAARFPGAMPRASPTRTCCARS